MNITTAHAPWALQLVVAIDVREPGFCGFYLRASEERRQVISAYLMASPPSEEAMGEVGRFLSSADHRAILQRAFGHVPTGLRGALRRSGPVVLDKSFYRLLFTHLSAPPHEGVVEAIQRMERVTRAKLVMLRGIPQDLCSADLTGALDAPGKARELVIAVNLLTRLGVDRAGMAAALRAVRSEDELNKAMLRWSLKASSPEHPVPRSECYQPISSPLELHRLGISWGNCARRYIVDLLAGTDAFAVFEHGLKRIVVHLQRGEDGHWVKESAWGPRNTHPARDTSNALDDYLFERGVRVRRHEPRERSEWDSLRRFTRTSFFPFEGDVDLDDLNFELDLDLEQALAMEPDFDG
ncbi:MAG: hypothetical protein KGP14_08150 [Betaproteobacteria bacterium]|nr:hypothetical protein [Betaproteobacteria bacterium]